MELITFAAGFALAIAFAILWLNHNFKTRPDWVFAKLAKYAGKIETQRDALKEAAQALHKAADAIRDRDDALSLNAAQEASDATQTATFYLGAARDAFNAGYASRPRCPGEPAPVGVQPDLRALWSAGAIPGSSGVPGKPRG